MSNVPNRNDFTHFTGGVADGITLVEGAAAGNVVVPKIAKEDKLKSVHVLEVDDGSLVFADLTDEFSVVTSEDGLINNTGGTSTADKVLMVEFVDVDREG